MILWNYLGLLKGISASKPQRTGVLFDECRVDSTF